jgi:hypothetical protein
VNSRHPDPQDLDRALGSVSNRKLVDFTDFQDVLATFVLMMKSYGLETLPPYHGLNPLADESPVMYTNTQWAKDLIQQKFAYSDNFAKVIAILCRQAEKPVPDWNYLAIFAFNLHYDPRNTALHSISDFASFETREFFRTLPRAYRNILFGLEKSYHRLFDYLYSKKFNIPRLPSMRIKQPSDTVQLLANHYTKHIQRTRTLANTQTQELKLIFDLLNGYERLLDLTESVETTINAQKSKEDILSAQTFFMKLTTDLLREQTRFLPDFLRYKEAADIRANISLYKDYLATAEVSASERTRCRALISDLWNSLNTYQVNQKQVPSKPPSQRSRPKPKRSKKSRTKKKKPKSTQVKTKRNTKKSPRKAPSQKRRSAR